MAGDLMKALILDAPHKMRLAEVPRPKPGEGELLIRVHHATICGTDIRIVDGRKTRDIRYGYPIGHECAGTVAAMGAGAAGYALGDRVAVCVVVSCGKCAECLCDRENLCDQRITLGYHTAGAFAEYMLIPAQAVRRGNVFKLPDEVPIEVAPLLEPMGCCINGQHEMRFDVHPKTLQSHRRDVGATRVLGCNAMENALSSPAIEHLGVSSRGASLLILAAGPIGLMHLMLARASEEPWERITVVEPLEHRQQYAMQFGADEVYRPDEFNAVEEFDAVIIAYGELSLIGTAMRAARKCGHLSLFAGFDKGASVAFDPNLVHYNQLRLTGGSESRRRDYSEALSHARSGGMALDRFVTHHFPLDAYEEAFRVAREREGLKVAFQVI